MSDRGQRQSTLIEATVYMIADVLMLEGAFMVTYWFRFYSGIWLVPLGIPPLSLYALASLVVLLVFLGIFYASGMYAGRGGRRVEDDLVGLFKGVVLGSLLVLALAFFLRRLTFSRSFFGLFFLSSMLFLTGGRFLARRLLRTILQRGMGYTRILLVGDSPMRDRVLRIARDLPGLAFRPVGWLRVPTPPAQGPAVGGQATSAPAAGALATQAASHVPDVREELLEKPAPSLAAAAAAAGATTDEITDAITEALRPEVAGVVEEAAGTSETAVLNSNAVGPDSLVDDLPCLGDLDDIRAVVTDYQIDRVVLTLPFAQHALVSATAERLANMTTDLQFVPDLFALHTSTMRLTDIAGIPFISVREVALSGADRIVKRSFDVVSTGLGLILLAPLLAVIAIALKLSSPGPVFYRQERIGRDDREFDMLKFRSMRADAELATGPTWTVADDPRVTGLGRFLRRWSLDELPQLWNVLVGDMSLVGPRPERRVFVERFSQQMPRYFERHRVKSGLTGWAQVHGLRGNTSITERTLYDLHYMENWSLALDVKILLMTVHHILRGDNAY